MYRFSPTMVSRLLLAGLCGLLAAPPLRAQTSVRAVKVLGAKDAVEIEVEASDRLVPQTQVLTGPDRLVVDFPNSVPSSQLRSQSVDRGEVKDVRVGLFQGKPPVTRIVLDLKTAQSYQIFPYGRTVIIKVMEGGQEASAAVGNFPVAPTRPGLVVANYTTGGAPVSVASAPPPSSAQPSSSQPTLDVSFHNGLLGIQASKVTLSQVLYAVQQRTGAEVSIASGAEQEQVVADIAPAPAPEVLARLLNGSRFNFLILSAANDPGKLDRVILSTRAAGVVMPFPPPPVQDTPQVEDASTAPAPNNPPLLPNPVGPAEVKSPPPPDNNAPN